MSFLDLIRARYSVRGYRADPIPDDLLNQVLEAARLAPTAANRQPFRVIVVHTAGRERELRRIYEREWFTQAPLVLCVVALPELAWSRVRFDGKSYAAVDAAIVMDHIILAATDLGLGTCWIAAFDPGAVREMLCLPAEVEPVALTPLGYPAGMRQPKDRKPLSELVYYDRWPE